jgi:DNA-directed RNA polymerase subunit alpha
MVQINKQFVSLIDSRVFSNQELYARFHLGSFREGQALTIANGLRRTLLAEIPGFFIRQAAIEGCSHEFSTLPGVQENTLTILLNLQQLSFRTALPINYEKDLKSSKISYLPKQIIGNIDFRGPGIIRASDICLPSILLPVDPTQYIATLSVTGDFKAQILIEWANPLDKPVDEFKKVDSLISERFFIGNYPKPVRKVNFNISKFSPNSHHEYISLEIYTDGSLTPQYVLDYAFEQLTRTFYDFRNLHQKCFLEAF